MAGHQGGYGYNIHPKLKYHVNSQTSTPRLLITHLTGDFYIYTTYGHIFQTYYGGQGHSPDNIVIWFDKEKILYGGCLVKSTEAQDLGNLSDANVKAWAATIKKIQEKFKYSNYIIPGHLDWQSKEALTHTLNLIQQYEDKKE